MFLRGTPPDAEYIFKHALVQDAAYGTLLRSRRQQLHARIAATLEERFPEIVLAQPALLGPALRGSRAGGKGGRLLAEGRSAGAGALGDDGSGRPAAEGVGRAGRPAGRPGRQQQELDLQIALGSALTATKGHSAAEVGETFARARALAEQMDRPEYLGRR